MSNWVAQMPSGVKLWQKLCFKVSYQGRKNSWLNKSWTYYMYFDTEGNAAVLHNKMRGISIIYRQTVISAATLLPFLETPQCGLLFVLS